MIKRIRKCNWTLRLKTQTGKCVINQIGELVGVGNVWYYPRGVSNMFPQFRMMFHSKWRVYHSANENHWTGDVKTLGFELITPQCFEY